jgi:hypothetical protein
MLAQDECTYLVSSHTYSADSYAISHPHTKQHRISNSNTHTHMHTLMPFLIHIQSMLELVILNPDNNDDNR